MFENVGDKIKVFSKVLFFITVVLAGIYFLDKPEEASGGSYALISLYMVLIGWVLSLFMYGFGEVIEKVTQIEINTRSKKDEDNSL